MVAKPRRDPATAPSGKRASTTAGAVRGPVSKTAMKSAGRAAGDARKKRKARHVHFNSYCSQMLTRLGHGDMNMTKSARAVVDELLRRWLDDVSLTTSRLMLLNKRKNAGTSNISAAVRLTAPEELGNYLVAYGAKAAAAYAESCDADSGGGPGKRARAAEA